MLKTTKTKTSTWTKNEGVQNVPQDNPKVAGT